MTVLVPSPEMIDAYLRSEGWAFARELGDAWKIYTLDGKRIEVPQRTDYADYVRRVRDALAVVAKVQKRPEPWELVAEAAVLYAGRLAKVRAMEGGE